MRQIPEGGGRLLGADRFRALSGRLKFTVRRHKFNKDSLSTGQRFGVLSEKPEAEQVALLDWYARTRPSHNGPDLRANPRRFFQT